jgi:DNA-binding NtrC family response regulator
VGSAIKILIIDDDPTHLKLYSWILERGGFLTTTALVGRNGAALPSAEHVFDLTVLDYQFQTGVKAVDVAKQIRNLWPRMRIVVLSDMMWMPEDIAPLVNGFVRKGEPQILLDTVTKLTQIGAD